MLDIDPVAPGAERHIFREGPITIEPGQNNIDFTGAIDLPTEDGWITRIAADVQREDGTVPPVDVIHLHHGVWINQSREGSGPGPEPVFAAGEEKTITTLPEGFGYRFDADDTWIINFMIHNQVPAPDEVYLSYVIDLIPTDAPEAAGVTEADPVWMDVWSSEIYPVFDVPPGGRDGSYTFPDDARDPYAGTWVRNEWTVPNDGVLIGTGGHVHPGGRHTDLFVRRDGARATNDEAGEFVDGDTALAFRSEAEYFDPDGPVSWDLAAHTTAPEWRVGVRAGDVLSISATYDTERSLAYEAMGIMVVWMADGLDGPDPFRTPVAADPGQVTHGHLAENDNHGGSPAIFDGDVEDLPDGPQVSAIPIRDFAYGQGDLSEGQAEVPVVAQGQSIEFDNSYDNQRANGIRTDGRWAVAPGEGVFVGYRIDEQFGGDTLNRTVVGRTSEVTGSLVLEDGELTEATVEADLTGLESDEPRRDAFLRGRSLETDELPTASFTLTEPVRLPDQVREGEGVVVDAVGTLDLHGVPRGVVIELDACVLPGGDLEAAGRLPITLADHDIETPDIPGLVRVEDHGAMELQLRFTPR